MRRSEGEINQLRTMYRVVTENNNKYCPGTDSGLELLLNNGYWLINEHSKLLVQT